MNARWHSKSLTPQHVWVKTRKRPIPSENLHWAIQGRLEACESGDVECRKSPSATMLGLASEVSRTHSWPIHSHRQQIDSATDCNRARRRGAGAARCHASHRGGSHGSLRCVMTVKMTAVDRLAILVLRRSSGRRLARQALRHAQRLYPAKPYQRCRFLLRTCWYREVSSVWFAFLDATPWRRWQVRLEPALAERLHRPYRRSDLTIDGRLSAAISHWHAFENIGWPRQALQFREAPYPLASFRCKDGVLRALVLCTSDQFAKEGDACLQLRSGQDALFTVAFSLRLPVSGSPLVVDIGCMQGPPPDTGRTVVRETTKALHGLRPRDLLLDAVRAVGVAAGARGLVGVCSARHIYRHWRKRRAFHFDYDQYWLERDGLPDADGDFGLSIHGRPFDISSVPSRKRAEAKRRHCLQIEMRAGILAALARSPITVASAPTTSVPGGSTLPLG